MLDNTVFQPLPPDAVKERAEAIGIGYQLIAFTLVGGHILMGCLAKHWIWDGHVVWIGFNTAKGQRFGHSHVAKVPVNLIADIRVIPLSEDSLPKVQVDEETLSLFREIGAESLLFSRLAVQDFPNPLASIISNHNLQVSALYDIEVLDYVEKALSEDALPPDGIKLENRFLLYADWDFFSQHVSGDVEVSGGIPGVVDVTKVLSPSLHERAFTRLEGSLTQKIKPHKYIKEHWMQGCILVEKAPQDTEIQGERCIVVTCASTDKHTSGHTFPILLKPKYLNFPSEFLGHIVSVLTFYGELLPIPIEVMGIVHHEALLARAVGYIP